MPRPKKSPAEIAEMRARILDATVELLEGEGPEALSIRNIARRLGVSHMVLYTYFENRQALFDALREQQQEHMRVRYEEAIRRAQAGDVVGVLRERLTLPILLAHTRPRLYAMAWVQPLPEAFLGELPIGADKHLQHFADLIQLGIESGQCVDRDPCLAAATALCIVHGSQLLYHSGRLADPDLREQLESEVIDVALAYLTGNHTNTGE